MNTNINIFSSSAGWGRDPSTCARCCWMLRNLGISQPIISIPRSISWLSLLKGKKGKKKRKWGHKPKPVESCDSWA